MLSVVPQGVRGGCIHLVAGCQCNATGHRLERTHRGHRRVYVDNAQKN